VIELHTGTYADSSGAARAREFERLCSAAKFAARLGLIVNAGHGLNYHNVQPIAAIPEIVELNIGHSIVARAIMDGLAKAVRDMKQLMLAARASLAQ
jgi:pyridoxine 5-phosphate synthase